MKKLLEMQIELQEKFRSVPTYTLPNPVDYAKGGFTVGHVYDFIALMKFCLNEELTELQESLGDGTRRIHKPWDLYCEELRSMPFVPSDDIKEEAIDALCFMMNIILTTGITPEDIENEYHKVWIKNTTRISQSVEVK